ncbi:MAG: VCBS repeat-containing protein [Candidatus Endobugula sp.]|jgi:VCBS repeat-containing protein
MAGEELVGKIDRVEGDGKVLIVRSTGEQIIAKAGDVLFSGDTVATSSNSRAVVSVGNGTVAVGAAESATFDDVLFDRIANLIINSSLDNPVNVGSKPSISVIRAFNETFPDGGTVTANESSQTETVVNLEDEFDSTSAGGNQANGRFVTDNIVNAIQRGGDEKIPDAGSLTDTGSSEKEEKLPDNGVPTNSDDSDTETPDDQLVPADATTAIVNEALVGGVVTENVAVYAGADTGSVTEDVDTDGVTAGVQLVSTGTLTISDVDTGDTPAITATTGADFKATGSTNGTALGGLAIDVSGNWTYTLDNTLAAAQALDASDTVTEIYTIKADDGTSHDITITINGAEDVSVYAGADTGSVTEDVDTDGVTAGVQLVSTGTLTISDVDTGDTPAITATTGADFKATGSTNGTALGGLAIDVSGNWTYTLDNTLAAAQALDASDTVTEIYTIKADDGTSHDITITINGAEDVSVYAGADTGSVTEDVDTDGVTAGVQLVSTGTLTISDVDTGDTPAITATTGADFKATGSTNGTALGGLAIDVSGNWTYTLDNSLAAVQALDASDTVTEIYTIKADDGTSHDITITINGAEDVSATPPVIEDNGGLVPESTGLLLRFFDNTVALDGIAANTEVQTEAQAATTVTRLTAGIGDRLIGEIGSAPTIASDSIGLGEGDANAITGLVYLTANSEYRIEGYRDDTLHVELGGQVVVSTEGNSYGSFSTGIPVTVHAGIISQSIFTAPANGYYTIEIYAANQSANGIINLALSENGISKPLSVNNYSLFAGPEDLINAGAQFGEFESNTGPNVAASNRNGTSVSSTTLGTKTDGGYFPVDPSVDVVSAGVTNSISLSSLTVSAQGTDTILSVVLSSIPVGAIISDGTVPNTYTSGSLTDTVDITSWTQSGLSIDLSGVSPPYSAGDTVTFDVEATSSSTTGAEATQTGDFTIGVLPSTYATDSGNGIEVENELVGTINDGNDDVVYGSGSADTLVAGSQFGVVIHGRAGNDTITGGDDNTSNSAENGNNTIFGGSGNDVIIGGSGEDIIFGGLGSDTLRGGFTGITDTDTDRFVWQSGDTSIGETDTILDFQVGSTGTGDGIKPNDILDFSALLSGELLNSNIDNYIYLSDSGSNTTLTFDLDGDGHISGYNDFTVELTDVTGVTLSQMITDKNIHTDSILQEANVYRGTVAPEIIIGTSADEIFYSNGDNTVGGSQDNVYGFGGKDTFVFDSNTAFVADAAADGTSSARLRDFTFGDTGSNSNADVLNIADFLDGTGLTATTALPYLHVVDNYYGTTLLFIDKEGGFDGADRLALDTTLGGNGADMFLRFAGADAFSTATGETDNTIAQLNALIASGNLVLD